MNYKRITAVLVMGSAMVARAGDTPQLIVVADTPLVQVVPRPAAYTSIRLPQLDYKFQIQSLCADNYQLSSVMVSVADTQKRFAADALKPDATAELTMRVPAKQIAPVGVGQFCIDDAESGPPRDVEFMLRGALSAQASMLCAGGDGVEQVTYVSASLDVKLSCVSELQ